MKTELDQAIGSVPPSTVTIDAVIQRGRRTVHTRQTSIALAAGAVVVVLFLGLVPFRSGGPHPVAAGGGPSRPPVVSGLPSVAPPTGPVAADIQQYLDMVVRDRIKHFAPGAAYVGLVPGREPGIISTYQAKARTYEAVALLRDESGVTELSLRVFYATPFPFDCPASGTPGCEVLASDDTQVFVQTGSPQKGGKPQNTVAAGLPDGRVVEVENRTDFTAKPGSATILGLDWRPEGYGKPGPRPVLTVGDLAKIAGDPRLSFYPDR